LTERGQVLPLEDGFALFLEFSSAPENGTVQAFLRNPDLSHDESRLQGVSGTGLGDNRFL
jgi:hypothetical protein